MSDEGAVWLADYTPGNTWSTGYTVVSRTGDEVGRVEFPGLLMVLDIAFGTVLSVFRDDTDVQGIALYRLNPGVP